MKEGKSKILFLTFLLGMGIMGISLILLALFNTVLKDTLIISGGIRLFSNVCKVVSFFAAGGGIGMLVTGIPLGKQMFSHMHQRITARNQQKLETKAEEQHAKDGSNPELTRKQLKKILVMMPDLEEVITDKCLQHMDRIDIQQDKLHSLIEANNAIYLEHSVRILDDVERRICQNLRVIVNLCIVVEDVADLDLERIRGIVDANEALLTKAKELLDVSAERVNQYNRDSNGADDASKVDDAITAIKRLLKEEK